MIKRPQSSTSLPITLIGLVTFLLMLFLLIRFTPNWSLAIEVVVILLAAAIPIIILEYLYLSPPLLKRLLKAPKINFDNWQRVFTKLLALYSIFLFVALVYWVFPEYHGNFYQKFWDLLIPILPWLVVLAIPYFFIVDELMEQPEDSYYFFGLWLLGQHKFESHFVFPLFLAWLVKLFFLPLMIVYFSNNIMSLLDGHITFSSVTDSFQKTYNFLWLLFFTIDVGFACIGYVLTLRLLDAHIRSTEPTTMGWVSTLICYQPFYGSVSAVYFAYNMDGYEWGRWLADSPSLYILWGSLILICLAIYAFATVIFGIRFSNLTNRGIITDGPYRFIKHPAFVSKNISWWLISIPFISQSNNISEVLRSCLMLLCFNGIYYIRAKTEERHLMNDPAYREYSQWIAENGIVAKIKNTFIRLRSF